MVSGPSWHARSRAVGGRQREDSIVAVSGQHRRHRYRYRDAAAGVLGSAGAGVGARRAESLCVVAVLSDWRQKDVLFCTVSCTNFLSPS